MNNSKRDIGSSGSFSKAGRALLANMVLGVLLVSCGGMPSTGTQSSSNSDFDAVPPPNFTRGLIARDEVQPLYPVRARNLGVEGWVLLRFTVDEEGYVMGNSIEIIEEEPRGYFDLSAISAARRLTFDNTRGEPVEDVRYVFRYELEELNRTARSSEAQVLQFRELIPRRYITPAYPPAAEADGIEGYVVVEFTVTEEGGIENIGIQDSNPPGVFDEEALIAASRMRFEPRLIFGSPVAVDNVTYRFDWRLPR